MHSYSKISGTETNKLHKTNSLCITPEQKLLELVLMNDTDGIKKIIKGNKTLLNHLYIKYYHMPILLVACIKENVNAQTVETLINFKADLRYSDKNQWEALHFAARRANFSILMAVVNGLKSIDCNINSVLAKNSNALHILIRHGNSNGNEFAKCAKLLIENGIDVNLGDTKAISPILWAAEKELRDIIKIIVESKCVLVDLDSPKFDGQTARDIINNKNLYDGILPEKVDNNHSGNNEESRKEIDTLFNYIKLQKENDFIRFKNIKNLVDLDNGNDTLLQLATNQNCKKIVEHLVDNGADSLKKTKKNQETPLEIAANHGFHVIFKILLKNVSRIPITVLTSLLKTYDDHTFKDKDKPQCCKYLFEKLESNNDLLDINEVDELTNSPLSYAVQYADAPVIEELLSRGASLGHKNKFNGMPIHDLEPDILEKHLDNCVQFDKYGKLTFTYRTLMPPSKKQKNYSNSDLEQGAIDSNKQELVYETEVISYMSTEPEFKHLLVHPVIVCFLFMKWNRICWLFYTNLVFYIAFFISLVLYVFSYYANFVEELSIFETFLRNFSWVILLVTFFVFVFREFFQLTILSHNYFTNFENYIEIMLILLSGSILFADFPTVNTRKQLSSLSILLAAFGIVLMVGKHPKLSTYVVMLKTVSFTFFKFLLWYSLLIIAFALSFYILFTEIPSNTFNNNTEIETEDSFSDVGNSIFKTIVMLTGEFETSNLNLKSFPIVGKLIFVLFIFIIAIILLNLLSALAVSDIQTIKNEAELLGHISRAQYIHYVEIMLLGNIVPKNIIKKVNDICCCFPFAENCNYVIFKPLAKKLCLFPYNYEIKVYKNGKEPKKMNQQSFCYNIHNLNIETINRIKGLFKLKKLKLK